MKWSAGTLVVPKRWSWEMKASLAGVGSVLVLMLGWLYLNLPVPLLPAFLGAGILGWITLRYPVFGVLTLVAAQYLPVGVGGFTMFQILGGLVTTLCLAYFGLTRRGLVFSWIIMPIVAFTLITIHSLSYTHDAMVTQYLIRKLVLNVLFCLLLINIVDDFRKLRGLLWVIAGMGMVNAMAGAIQFAAGFTVQSRAKGFQENENQLGEISALGLMVAIYVFLYGDRWWKQLLGLLMCVVLSFGLVTSISRGAVIALLVGLTWIGLRESQHRKRVVVFASLAALALPFLPDSFLDRFRNLNTDLRGTVVLQQRVGLTTRGYFNKAGIKIWKANPVLGVGLGNFGYYYIQPQFNPGMVGYKKLPPHNIYVQALAETGTVGFLVLCWWIVQAGFNYWRAERKFLEDRANRGTLRACEALTIVNFVAYFSSGNLAYSSLAMVLTFSYLCRRCVDLQQASSEREPIGTLSLSST
jgi:O-antigen ligase